MRSGACARTCRPDLTLGTSEELVWIQHLKGTAVDETGHINRARLERCCTPRKRY